MDLEMFQFIISKQKKDKFQFGISKPFAWQGNYEEVAFSIIEEPTKRIDILANIDLALKNTFEVYENCFFKYSRNAKVHFEEQHSCYPGESYVLGLIDKYGVIGDLHNYDSLEGALILSLVNLNEKGIGIVRENYTLKEGLLTSSGNFKLDSCIKSMDELMDVIANKPSVFCRHKMYPTAFIQNWTMRTVKMWLDRGFFWKTVEVKNKKS